MLKFDKNRFYQGDDPDNPQAEITFEPVGEKEYNVTHTFVDSSLRGQGLAEQLMDAVANHARKENRKLRASCSYARMQLERNPKYADLKA